MFLLSLMDVWSRTEQKKWGGEDFYVKSQSEQSKKNFFFLPYYVLNSRNSKQTLFWPGFVQNGITPVRFSISLVPLVYAYNFFLLLLLSLLLFEVIFPYLHIAVRF